MLTGRGFELTVQFCASPLSCTAWLPGDSPLKLTLVLMLLGSLGPSSTTAVVPSGSGFDPVVLVVTFRVPVVGAQLTEKVVVVVVPAVMLTMRGFELTV